MSVTEVDLPVKFLVFDAQLLVFKAPLLVFNAQLLVFNAQFLVFNAQFLVLNTQFLVEALDERHRGGLTTPSLAHKSDLGPRLDLQNSSF